MATLCVFICQYLGFKCIWVSVNYCLYSHFPLFVIFSVRAVLTIAVRSTTLSKGKTITIQFKAPWLFTITSNLGRVRGSRSNRLCLWLVLQMTGWCSISSTGRRDNTLGRAKHGDSWFVLLIKIDVVIMLGLNLLLHLMFLGAFIGTILLTRELVLALFLAWLLECPLHTTVLLLSSIGLQRFLGRTIFLLGTGLLIIFGFLIGFGRVVKNVNILMNSDLLRDVLLRVVIRLHSIRLSVAIWVGKLLGRETSFLGYFIKCVKVLVIVGNSNLELAGILEIWNIIFLITHMVHLVVYLWSHVQHVLIFVVGLLCL